MNASTNHGKVLVTGDAGFIGRRLREALLQCGRDVIGIDRNHGCETHPPLPGYTAVDLDLTVKTTRLRELVHVADEVFHVAALTRAKNAGSLTNLNTSMTRNLLDACLQKKDRPRFILVSSISACGPQKSKRPLDEKSELEPVSQYGRSKAACERVAMNLADQLPISIVRPPIVLGPRDKTGLAMFHVIQKWHRHFVAGHAAKHGIVHVDDLVNAMMLVAKKGERSNKTDLHQGTYVVATQDSISYDELGRVIASLLNIPNLKIRYVPGILLRAIGRLNDLAGAITGRPPFLSHDKVCDSLAGSWAVNSKKIRKLGFRPGLRLVERLDETIRWYQAHGWLRSTTQETQI